MSAKRSRRKGGGKIPDKPIFAGIRKPGAPPGHPITQARPDEKARPALRKAKHKSRPDISAEADE